MRIEFSGLRKILFENLVLIGDSRMIWKDYRDGARTSDNGLMAATVKNLSNEQIDAVAQYLTGL